MQYINIIIEVYVDADNGKISTGNNQNNNNNSNTYVSLYNVDMVANVSIIIFVDQTRSFSRLMNETNFNSCQPVRIVNLNYHASNSAFKRNNIL